jgi:hypothetical protein
MGKLDGRKEGRKGKKNHEGRGIIFVSLFCYIKEGKDANVLC